MSLLFDPAPWLKSRTPALPRLAFERLASHDPATVRAWQADVVACFKARLGSFPESPCPLNARSLTEPVAVEGAYRREEIAFDGQSGLPVFGYFLTPLTGAGPFPLLLCLNGHGDGVNPLVGLDKSGAPVPELDYHHGFAIEAVQRGYAVLAIEILGFGRRAIGTDCSVVSGSALMLGETIAAWRTYDAIRAIDYALTRPDVAAGRIGAMGISGGGLNAFFLAAVDDRVKAAVVSGYFNEFTECVMNISHCIDNFIPGLRLDLEMSDIAGAIAPRALWCENGSDDTIFPVTAFRRAIEKATWIYDALGVADRIHGHVFEGEHQFNGEGCWPFLERFV